MVFWFNKKNKNLEEPPFEVFNPPCGVEITWFNILVKEFYDRFLIYRVE